MITAKELAKKLGLSQTAVSMALNGKRGVSKETRDRVIAAAEENGYDFSRIQEKERDSGVRNIAYVSYRVHNAIMYYSAIESEYVEGMQQECGKLGYRLRNLFVTRDDPDLEERITDLRTQNCAGLIVLGTEMQREDIERMLSFSFPTVFLDSDYYYPGSIAVSIDNIQGTYLATEYLLHHRTGVPGYLASAYRIRNFKERRIGFENALRDFGKSPAVSIRHDLTPSIEAAEAEMGEILKSGRKPAAAYVAENDFLAIGVMQALKAAGYRIPEDVAIVGCDDIREDRICEPQLTSVHVPFHFMGRMAVESFNQLVNNVFPYQYRVTVCPTLTERHSV